MIIMLDDRAGVADGFVALFHREGVTACTMDAADVSEWLSGIVDADLAAVEAFLVGEVSDRTSLCQKIASRTRNRTVLIATKETITLDETLELFAAGVDDVIRKPIHVREIFARIQAVARRSKVEAEPHRLGRIEVFCDGRDPLVAGVVLALPRRERRILEFLMSRTNCRVSKAQIFHAVYGLFNDDIDENVVESHISKLRKRLRERLGYDPVDSKRFLGYRLVLPGRASETRVAANGSSFAQVDYGLMHAET